MQKKVTVNIIVVALFGFGLYFFTTGNKNTTPTQASISTSVDSKAPTFVYTTLDGTKIESPSLRGKIIVITSSAAWCPTCSTEAQQFAPIYQKYKGDSVAFVTVDIDPRDTRDFIEKFKKDNHTPWDYADARGGSDISQKFGFNRFEITYIIDRTGVIRFRDNIMTSTDRLDVEIQKLL